LVFPAGCTIHPMVYGPHIEAEVTFLLPEEGGRKSPALTGYRPQFYYDGHDWDAEHNYPDVGKVNPGETARALLTFISPEFHRNRVHPGMTFEIREGARVVGRGKVTRLLSVEAEIRQLFYVATYYIKEAATLSGDSDPIFQKLFEEEAMREFQQLFSNPALVLSTAQERCVRLVAHAGSAAVRLETIMECLHGDFRDKTLAARLGTRACEFLRHVVAHRQSYRKTDKDLEQQQEIQRRTAKAILADLQNCYDKIRAHLVERKLLSA
jgi:hypothetical protein